MSEKMRNIELIAANVVSDTLEGKEGTLPELFLEACREAKRSIWVFDEDKQLRIAVAGLMMRYEPDSVEWRRLAAEWRTLTQIQAILTASSLGLSFDALNIEEDKDLEPIGIIRIWSKA